MNRIVSKALVASASAGSAAPEEVAEKCERFGLGRDACRAPETVDRVGGPPVERIDAGEPDERSEIVIADAERVGECGSGRRAVAGESRIFADRVVVEADVLDLVLDGCGSSGDRELAAPSRHRRSRRRDAPAGWRRPTRRRLRGWSGRPARRRCDRARARRRSARPARPAPTAPPSTGHPPPRPRPRSRATTRGSTLPPVAPARGRVRW